MSMIKTAFLGLILVAPAAALAQPGFIDPSFGGGDFIANWTSAGGGVINRVLAQGDGRIVAVGATNTFNGWGAMRFNSTGTLDASFGNGGIAIPAPSWPNNMLGQSAIDGAVQSDGKIVMIDIEFDVLRLNANGTLDTSFGSGGIAQFLLHNGAHAIYGSTNIAVGPDGKITIVGNNVIARLNANGSRDATLGTKQTPGYVNSQPGDQIAPRKCLLIGSDGRITAAGTNGTNCLIARYLASGAPDSSFGVNGRVVFTITGSEVPSGLAFTVDGRIVVAGRNSADPTTVFVARFTSAGAPDPTFGTGGATSRTFAQSTSAAYGGVSVQSDGGALVPMSLPDGGHDANGNPTADMAVWRLTSLGTSDPAFGPTVAPVLNINDFICFLNRFAAGCS